MNHPINMLCFVARYAATDCGCGTPTTGKMAQCRLQGRRLSIIDGTYTTAQHSSKPSVSRGAMPTQQLSARIMRARPGIMHPAMHGTKAGHLCCWWVHCCWIDVSLSSHLCMLTSGPRQAGRQLGLWCFHHHRRMEPRPSVSTRKRVQAARPANSDPCISIHRGEATVPPGAAHGKDRFTLIIVRSILP